MNVVETIREKVFHLPLKAQEEVLELVEKIEERYHIVPDSVRSNGAGIRELFGSVSLGFPTGSENESIDADLAHEYMSKHDED